LIELVDLGFYKIKQWYYSKLSTYQKYALDTKEVLVLQIEMEDKVFSLMENREFHPYQAVKFDVSMPALQEAIKFGDKGYKPQEAVKFNRPII